MGLLLRSQVPGQGAHGEAGGAVQVRLAGGVHVGLALAAGDDHAGSRQQLHQLVLYLRRRAQPLSDSWIAREAGAAWRSAPPSPGRGLGSSWGQLGARFAHERHQRLAQLQWSDAG